MLAHIFELMPVALALVATISCAHRFNTTRHKPTRNLMLLAVICAIIMMIAQTTWWSYWTLRNEMVRPAYTAVLWTVFNILSMVAFIYASLRRTNG